jgi:hypothetical protein
MGKKGIVMKRFNAKKVTIRKGYLTYKRKNCHRIIWEQDVGPIPDGYDIHHKDGNKFNNLLSNLECLSKSDHMALHANENREKMSKCMSDNSEKIHAWLNTEKGKKFLSEKAKKQWEEQPLKDFICAVCFKQFQTKHNRKNVKFCSDACVMRARVASGVDNVERPCVICSNLFTINKYQKTVTCSKPCRAKHIGNLKRKH